MSRDGRMLAKYTRRREELGSICVRESVAAVRKEWQLEDDENDDGLSDEDGGENHLGKLEIVVGENIELIEQTSDSHLRRFSVT